MTPLRILRPILIIVLVMALIPAFLWFGMSPLKVLLFAAASVTVPLWLYYVVPEDQARRTLPIVTIVVVATLFAAFIWFASGINR